MTTPAIAPYVPTYATYTPYITAEEFLNAPTGVDLSQLIPAGSILTQEAAVADLIARASSQVDLLCQKVLAATVDVQAGTYRVRDDYDVWIPVDYTPIVQLNSVAAGCDPANLTVLSDLSRVRIERKLLKIPLCGVRLRSRGFGWEAYVQATYVNGWAHSTLSAEAAAAATSITPVSVLGLVPNLPFTIKDGASSELATVGAGYVVGAATVPLAAPLYFAHQAGATVSALPPAIKDATIDLAKWLVKSHGSKAIVMGAINGQKISAPKTQKTEPGGDEDYQKAVRTLQPFKRSR